VFKILQDDLSGEAVRALLALHLSSMRSNTPSEYAFALDLSGLSVPEITLWSVWDGPELAGIGALKDLGARSGEIKSMRTDPKHLRKGVASALLAHIITEASRRDWRRISLETGSGPMFEPALALYRKHGFANGPAFGGYVESEFNQFLHLELEGHKVKK
jgi:putative acetyltransferase